MNRTEIIDKAKDIIDGEREGQYGTPEDSFSVIADMWSAYLRGNGVNIDYLGGYDVATMMILLKVARISTGNYKDDNWVDIVGYAVCGGELEAREDV